MATKKRVYKCVECGDIFKGPVEVSKHFKGNPSHRTRKQQLKFESNQRNTKIRRAKGGIVRKSVYGEVSKGLPVIRRKSRVVAVRRKGKGKMKIVRSAKFCTDCGSSRKASHAFCGGCGLKLAN